MTNRERAESIWPAQCRTRSQAIPAIESALDAAERRGLLAGRLAETRDLLKATMLLTKDLAIALRLREEQLLAELKAAEAKR